LAAGEDKIRVSGVLKKLEKFSLNYIVIRWKPQEHNKTARVEISLSFVLPMR